MRINFGSFALLIAAIFLVLRMPVLTADTRNPSLMLWLNIKLALLAEDGEKYFKTGMKGAMVPGGAYGLHRFRAKLVSAKPSSQPTVLVVALRGEDPEATLRVKYAHRAQPDGLKQDLQPGTRIEFQGIPVSFSKEPFMVTFDVTENDLKFESPSSK